MASQIFYFSHFKMSETLINESCLRITTALDHLQNQTLFLFWFVLYLVCCRAEPCRPPRVPPRRECACRESCAASAGQRGAGDPCTGRLCAERAACGGSGESGQRGVMKCGMRLTFGSHRDEEITRNGKTFANNYFSTHQGFVLITAIRKTIAWSKV